MSDIDWNGEQEFAICSVTAVHRVASALGTFLLVGEGAHLKIYNEKDRKLVCESRVFESQPLHGLQCNPSVSSLPIIPCLIWGGRHVTVVHIRVHKEFQAVAVDIKKITDDVVCRHWILHGSFLSMPAPYDPSISLIDLRATLVTTGNELLLLELGHTTSHHQQLSMGVTRLCRCPSSILYSADSKLHNQEYILVAAGTVFGEILLWTFHLGSLERNTGTPSKAKTIHSFVGHDGSVFGISIAATPEGQIILASCSDDRTVKVWNTGLSRKDDLSAFPTEAAVGITTAAAQASGHHSRIWSVTLRLFSETSGLVVSFGEDCVAQEWSLALVKHNESGSMVGTLDPARSMTAHSGRNIWSAYVQDNAAATAVIATGGADGQVTLYEAVPSVSDNASMLWVTAAGTYDSLQVESIGLRLADGPQRRPREDPKVCVWLGNSSALAVSDTGSVLLGQVLSPAAEAPASSVSICQDVMLKWVKVFRSAELRSYSTLLRIPECGAAIAGVRGNLFLYRSATTEVVFLDNLSKKVTSMFSVKVPLGNEMHSAILVTCAGTALASLFIVREGAPIIRSELVLPQSTIVTSAVFSLPSQSLILGTRLGSLCVFEADSLYREGARPCVVLPSDHAREAITSIIDLGAQDHSQQPLILTTSRNGKILVHAFIAATSAGNGSHLVKVHEGECPAGVCPEGAAIDPATGSLIIWGFRGTYLVILNITTHAEMARVDCGGSHRNWDVLSCAGISGSICVAWSRASSCQLRISDRPAYTIVKAGTHGREIKCLAVQPAASQGEQLIATGSEDTEIHISTMHPGSDAPVSSPLRVLSRIRRHVTGPTHLAWSTDGGYVFSAGGKEEFFVWRVRRIPHIALGVVCEAAAPPVSEAADLRVMGFDVQSVDDAGRARRAGDGGYERGHGDGGGNEACDAPHAFVITMVYSDSSVRMWHFDSSRPPATRLALRAHGVYGVHCLTSAHSVRLGPDAAARLLTASTDGHIALWLPHDRLQEGGAPRGEDGRVGSLACAFRHKVHQSAVKSLDVQYLSDSTALVATGGDDNALGLTLVGRGDSAGPDAAAASTLLVPKAHAAAVTAVRILHGVSEAESKTVVVASASNDQRLALWRVVWNGFPMGETGMVDVRRLKVHRMGWQSSDIADISGVHVIRGGRLVVAGVGLEVWGGFGEGEALAGVT